MGRRANRGDGSMPEEASEACTMDWKRRRGVGKVGHGEDVVQDAGG